MTPEEIAHTHQETLHAIPSEPEGMDRTGRCKAKPMGCIAVDRSMQRSLGELRSLAKRSLGEA